MVFTASCQFIALAALASSAAAGPLIHRQVSAPSPSAAQTTLASTVSPSGLAGPSDLPSAVASASSALGSLVSSAAGNSAVAPAPTGTPVSSDPSGGFAYACPANYSLTYVLGTNTYPAINITTAYNALINWTTALPPPIQAVNASGSGVGAQRTWSLNALSVTEQLVNQTINYTTGFEYINQNWVSLSALNVSPSLIIANATSDLTLYNNNATNGNMTSVQFYVNFCASSQQAGLDFYSQIVSGYLTGLNALFLNTSAPTGPVGGPNGTVPIPSAVDPASSAAGPINSAIGSASSAVVSGPGSVPSALSASAPGASSAVGGIAGTITSGAVGAASTAISAITGAANTAISGAASVASAIAGPFTA